MRRVLLMLGAVLLAIASSPALPAYAHGQLAFSDPANESTLAEARERIALYFTEKPVAHAYFTLTTPSGIRVDGSWSHGEQRLLDQPVQELNLRDGKWEPVLYHYGFPAMVTVSHWPETGVYTARYLTVASDGDRVSGTIRFDYQGPITAAPAGWQQPVGEPHPALMGSGPPPVAAAPPPSTSEGSSGWVWLPIAGAVVIAAAVGLLLMRRRPALAGALTGKRGTTAPAPAAKRGKGQAGKGGRGRKRR